MMIKIKYFLAKVLISRCKVCIRRIAMSKYRSHLSYVQVDVFWFMTPRSVVGYQRFGRPCCLHLHVCVFWVVTPSSVVVGYQRFRGPYCLHLNCSLPIEVSEDGGSMELCNVGILPQYYTASQPQKQDLEHHRRESLKTRNIL
jgi:hypothetical protein